jgi:hypothetical protein
MTRSWQESARTKTVLENSVIVADRTAHVNGRQLSPATGTRLLREFEAPDLEDAHPPDTTSVWLP